MKTLVIHPKDFSTDFLCEIYSDKNWTILDTNTSNKNLKEQIKNHERIVMLGHGSEVGLFGYNKMVIDSKLVYLLREKYCVCIWCNADMFFTKYNLKGFYTGMIISDYEEALLYSISINTNEIEVSNKLFADAIKKSIDMDNMLDNAKKIYSGDGNIISFNRNNLYCT